jgi:hypothetical protein
MINFVAVVGRSLLNSGTFGLRLANADGMGSGSGHLKRDKGLTTKSRHFVLVQEGIKGWKDGRQRPEVAMILHS